MRKYLMYLRKSRTDKDFTEADTLKRHKDRLVELCRSLGLFVGANDILQEVSSGDSIASRPMMIELLRRVESGEYAAVICMDMDRLSRGSGADQALVINTFKYSGTKIITPSKTYDFADDMDEQFAELGLFIGRNEYRMIKKRLMQGRIASAKEGKFCTGNPPYGYEVYKLTGQKGFSLRIVPEEAEVVRSMFDMYIDHGKGYKAIAAELNAAGIPSKHGPWSSSHVYKIMSDPTYCGMIRFRYKTQEKVMKDGEVVKTERRNADPIISKGLHEGIITEERFAQAQEAKKTRRTPHVKLGFRMANPFCSLVKCAYCGKNLSLSSKDKKGREWLRCNTPGCNNHAVMLSVFEDRVLCALGEWLKAYEVVTPIEDKGKELKAQETALKSLTRQIEEERKREEKIMSLFEEGIYTLEDFQRRLTVCRESIARIEADITKTEEEAERLRRYEKARKDLAPAVRSVVDHYYSLPTPKDKNLMLKQILEKVEFEKTTKGRGTEDDFTITVFPRLPQ